MLFVRVGGWQHQGDPIPNTIGRAVYRWRRLCQDYAVLAYSRLQRVLLRWRAEHVRYHHFKFIARVVSKAHEGLQVILQRWQTELPDHAEP